MVVVIVQVSVLGLYLPPVSKALTPSKPPQTIISLPVQTAVWRARAVGVLVTLVAVQLSVLGLYLPPVFNALTSPNPPHTIISLPVQTAVCESRRSGGPAVAVQVSSMHPPVPIVGRV